MSQVQVTEREFDLIVNQVVDAASDLSMSEQQHAVAEKLKPYFDVTPDNVQQLRQPPDRSHGGRVSQEAGTRGIWPESYGSVKMRAIPYDGDVYLCAPDVVELAQKVQAAGDGISALITHLTGPTVAGQMLVGREGDGD